MRNWLMNGSFENVFNAESANEKAELFQRMLIVKFEDFFPEKIRKISSVYAPWITQKLKKLDRKRKRIYHKERRSDKWKNMNEMSKKQVKCPKESFYKSMIGDLRHKHPSKWYSSLKRITGSDQKADTKLQKYLIKLTKNKLKRFQNTFLQYLMSIMQSRMVILKFHIFPKIK